jgi:hypothetical protein
MGRSQGRITSAGLTLCSKGFEWLLDPYAATPTNQTYGCECVLARAQLAQQLCPSNCGNYHRQNVSATVTVDKSNNFVFGLSTLLPLEA